MLARAPGAVSPHLERALLLLRDPEAKSQEEQRLAGQAEDLVEAERAGFDDQRLDQLIPHAAALLVIPNRETGDLREARAVDLEAAAADDASVQSLRHH